MKKYFLIPVLFLLSGSVFAWTIGPMNYQGRLLDNAGIPVTGSYNFKVRIYDALSGGTLKFSEQQNSIAVNDGVYSFLVSTGTSPTGSWDINLWNTPTLYLEIEVNGQTLTPRHLLASTPFAFQANLALTTNNALALGGVSASQYQNTLADICTSGKGKWLELVSKCLGIGASFPGPTMVALNTLTASTDLSGLDLSRADIRGINFGAANLSATLFKDTKLTLGGIATANLTGATLDGVIVTANVAALSTNFTNTKISNMNMASWNLNATNLAGASIADLTACPSSLPANYLCKEQQYLSGKYIILGPNMNFSETSLMKDRLNSTDVYQDLFGSVNISGSTFKGNKIESWQLSDSNLSGAHFDQTTIRNAYVSSSNVDSTSFSECAVFNMQFSQVQSVTPMYFQSSELNRVSFYTGALPVSINFQSVTLNDAEFDKPWGGGGGTLGLDVENSALNNVRIYSPTTSIFIFDTTISGGIYLGDMVTGLVMENAHFVNGNIGGNWRNLTDNSSTYINVSFFGADLTGATGLIGSPPWMINVNWYGAICPDGYHVATQGGTCVGHGVEVE